MSNLNKVLKLLPSLSRSELEAVVIAATDLMAREDAMKGDAAASARTHASKGAPPPSGGAPAAGKRGRGKGYWIEAKIINGCGPYLYRRWREGGRVRSEYIGKAGG